MRKIYAFALAAFLAGGVLAGCSNNEESTTTDPKTKQVKIKVGYDQFKHTKPFSDEVVADTKVHYNPETNFYGWDEGDEVSLFIMNWTKTPATVVASNIKLTAEPESGGFPAALVNLVGSFDADLTEAAYDYFFIYPYSPDITAVNLEGYGETGTANFKMPIKNEYDVVNGVIKGLPRFGSSTELLDELPQEFKMKTPYSLLCVPLTMDASMTGDFKLTQVLINTNDNQILGGTMNTQIGSNGSAYLYRTSNQGQRQWIFNYGDGITLNSSSTEKVWMALPRPEGVVSRFVAGITITFVTDKGRFAMTTISDLFIEAGSKSTISDTPLSLSLEMLDNDFTEITPGTDYSGEVGFWN